MVSFWGILWVAFACRSLFCSLGLRKTGLAEVVWRRNSCRTSWQNPSGYFSLVCFLDRLRSALMEQDLSWQVSFGCLFICGGVLRSSAFSHMVWRYSSRQRMAESFLVEQTFLSCCSLHGGHLSHVLFHFGASKHAFV